MNQHLNLFRYFNESSASEFLENNLSRAFAICLQHDAVFFSHYLKAIVEETDYEYLFNYYTDDAKYLVDLQVNTSSIEMTDIRKVYGIAMTSDEQLDFETFFSLNASPRKETNLTDVFILIKDIALVIEVKRDNADCRQQLFDQLVPFQQHDPAIDIKAKNFSWKHTVSLMEQVVNIQRINGLKDGFVSDFLSLSELKHPYWFSSKPFAMLTGLADRSPKSLHARHLRMKQIINHSHQAILDYADRLAIGVQFEWASEIIPFFETINGNEYIDFVIWPGNTKGQGYSIYNRPSLHWIDKKELVIQGAAYKIRTSFHMKFSHFNRYVTALDFNNSDLLKPVNTKNNFEQWSGKRSRAQWPEFENFLDAHFKQSFKWREQCGYEKYFSNTDRNYFTVSFGFVVHLLIPYKHFQNLDKSVHDDKNVSSFVDSIVAAYQGLLD